MKNTLGCSLVDALDGKTQGVFLSLRPGSRNSGLLTGVHLGSDCPIPKTTLLILTIALDLALDVGHEKPR